jgi:hypothetical protein
MDSGSSLVGGARGYSILRSQPPKCYIVSQAQRSKPSYSFRSKFEKRRGKGGGGGLKKRQIFLVRNATYNNSNIVSTPLHIYIYAF